MPSMMTCLDGFQIQAACQMAKVNKPSRDPHAEELTYPSSKDVLEEVGLRTIDHYIRVRRETVAHFIRERPIFEKTCGRGEATWYLRQMPALVGKTFGP